MPEQYIIEKPHGALIDANVLLGKLNNVLVNCKDKRAAAEIGMILGDCIINAVIPETKAEE